MMLQRNEHDSAYSVSEIIQTCESYNGFKSLGCCHKNSATFGYYLPKVALIYMVGKYLEWNQFSLPLRFSSCTDLQLAVLQKAR